MLNGEFCTSSLDASLMEKWFPKNMVDFPNLDAAPIFSAAVKEAYLNVQAPFELAALTGLSAMSLVAQRLTCLCTPYGSNIPLSIWILGVAESGERKDGLRNYFFEGINEFDKAVFGEVNNKKSIWRSDETLWKRKVKLLERRVDGMLKDGVDVSSVKYEIEKLYQAKPCLPVYIPSIIEDITAPALAKHLIQSNGIAAIVSSEGGAFLQSAIARDIPLLNSAWSGSEINVARKGDGVISIKDPKVSLMMLIQPGALDNYLAKKGGVTRDMGFWARFLVAKPTSTQGHRHASDNAKSCAARGKFAMRCKELLEAYDFADKSGPRSVLELSYEAAEVWRAISNDIEFNLREGLHFSRARDHASKLAENILRVAGVLHVFEGRDGGIAKDLLLLAVKICAYCSGMFISVFDKKDKVSVDAGVLRSWLAGNANSGFRYIPLQYAYRRAPNSVRGKVNLIPALDCLFVEGVVGRSDYGRMVVIDLYPNLTPDGSKMVFDCACLT